MAETVSVNPELIRWAADRSQLPAEDLAERFPKLDDWTRGKRMPTFRQLEEFANRTMTRNRKIYPNEESALKIVFMAIREASRKWTLPIKHWKQALNHFAILFEDRLPQATSK